MKDCDQSAHCDDDNQKIYSNRINTYEIMKKRKLHKCLRKKINL